jgi:homoserine dehydrogenase
VLGPSDPLVALEGARNAVELERADGTRDLLRGRGAGGAPTAEALLGDLLELRRERARAPRAKPIPLGL